jgi:predicted O-methyltransferase YrrM
MEASDVTKPDLSEYVEQLFGGEDSVLRRMREEAESAGLPQIQVPFELGRLLSILIGWKQPKAVLEIGTLYGYSTVMMAKALPAGSRLTTLEVNPRHAEHAERNLSAAGVDGRVDLMLGPALESLGKLEGRKFDFVFIDADKQTYPQYLEWSLKLTQPGSLIAADNVWRGGDILLATNEADIGIAAFNRAVAAEPRLISTIISTRGGRDGTSISLVR